MRGPRYKTPSEHDIAERQFIITDARGEAVYNDDGEILIGAVLDHQSIVKQQLGKLAYGAELGAGIEQLLHPEIGAAVEHTGAFWRNPYRRVAVSMDPIMAVVYADNPPKAGEYVRRLHEGIHGTDASGQKFNALSPEAFYWAHETFRSGVEKTARYYSKSAFTPADQEQLQLESATWYSYYGMPMGQTPADVAANQRYRQHIINDVLTMNPSAERAINLALYRQPPRPEAVPRQAWWLAKAALLPVTELVSAVTLGEIDPQIRQRFGIPFSDKEQRTLQDIRMLAQATLDSLPHPLRYAPIAYQSLRREESAESPCLRDELLYQGIRLGSAAMQRTVRPALQSIYRHTAR